MIVESNKISGLPLATSVGVKPIGFDPISLGISAGIQVAASLITGWIAKRGAQKVAATQIVNEAEPLLQQNLAAWNGSNKTKEEQTLVLDAANKILNAVFSACGDEKLGSAGERCISERNRGGRYDWYSYYYDPIVNDPDIGKSEIIERSQDNYNNSLPNFIPNGFDVGKLFLPLAVVGIGYVLLASNGRGRG